MGVTDFDFLLGTWEVHNSRADGTEFRATVMAEKVLDGRAILEHYAAEHLRGLAIIAYDQDADTWAHSWIETRVAPDFTPLIGKFSGGVGEFHGTGIRFLWDRITPNSHRWQQAVLNNSTWDTNWVMEYTRTGT